MPSLPITAIFDRLRESLRQHRGVVLQAPPGAGKTTGVPLALLDEPWLQAKRIIMLEPRRLAARAAAFRMAELLGEPVGATVGYRIRMESRVGPETRIEVVTEGVLIRMLQTDSGYPERGLVVFDEFHERSLAADLGLALCRDIQEGYNETLRLLVMSATIETTPVAGLLGQAPILTCPGQSLPGGNPLPRRQSPGTAGSSGCGFGYARHIGRSRQRARFSARCAGDPSDGRTPGCDAPRSALGGCPPIRQSAV